MLKCTTHVTIKHNKKKFDKNKDHRIIIMDIKHGHLWRKKYFETSIEVAAFAFVSVSQPPAARGGSSLWPGASWHALIGGRCA